MRITKVDLVAKGLRSFATLDGEARLLPAAVRAWIGGGVQRIARSKSGIALRFSAPLGKNQNAATSGGPRCLDCSGFGGTKKSHNISVVAL